MNKNLRRSVVALATTLACVTLLASPALAATSHAKVTGGAIGLLNSTGTVSDFIPIGNTATGGLGA